jgi:DNA mismatch repair ATPase MutS
MILQNYFSTIEPEPEPESKKDHELNTSDRMHLINKKIDDTFINEMYIDIIDNKQFINTLNNIEINDYVYNDVEFLHDHYINEENGIFKKLNKCQTKIGSLLLKNIFLKPIFDTELLKKRQDMIIKISSIKNKLLPLINNIKELENDLMWFWNNPNMKHIELMNDMIYFNYDIIPFFNVNDILNNNEKALLIISTGVS